MVTYLDQRAYAEPTEVFVIISRVEQLISPDGEAPGDYFAKVKIGNDANFLDSSDNDGPNIFTPESSYAIDPYWVLSANVERGLGTIPIVIQLQDPELFDDVIDINPASGKTQLDLQLDLNTGSWSGDVPSNQRFSQGPGDGSHDGDGSAKVFFDIAVGDIDRDGIPDKVELSGVQDANGNLIPDFTTVTGTGFGFPMDPCRKTVAVEIDYMQGATTDGHTHKPLVASINNAVSAFDNANTVPAVTPCPYPGFTKSSGVNLVVDVDDPIPEAPFLHFGNGFEIVKTSNPNFNPARIPYFHYNLWVHSLSSEDGTRSGFAEIGGNDFIVSLGGWTNNAGSVPEQTGTFIHELGHNLGLLHGGDNDDNCKPNYLSVMNYVFQTVGIIEGYGIIRFDYSPNVLNELDEEDLVESTGIGDTFGYTKFGGHDPPPIGKWEPRDGRGNGWIDWDGDGFMDSDTVHVNLNLFWDKDACKNWLANAQILTSFDDWRHLDYVFRDDDDYGDGIHNGPETPELTFEESEATRISQERFMESLRPVANAGPDQTVIEGIPVTLDGSASSNAVTHDWTQVNVGSVSPTVTLSDPRAAKPTFVAPSVNADTVLTFQLVVNDGQVNSSPDIVSMTVRDVCPPGQHWDQTESICVPDTLPPEQPTINVGNEPLGIAYNPTNDLMYVTNHAAHSVSLISDDTLTSTIQNPNTVDLFGPHGIAYNPSNNMMYVVNRNGDNTVSVLDGTTIVDTITVGASPTGVAYNSHNNKMYIANAGHGTVSIIDSATNTVTATVQVEGNPFGVAFNPGNNYIYVTNGAASEAENNYVSLIDSDTNQVIKTVTVGASPTGVAYNPQNNNMYVANSYGHSVSVIDSNTNDVIDTIYLREVAAQPVGPVGIAYNPIDNNMYVAGSNTDTVYVIGSSGNDITNSIPVGDGPYAIAFNEENRKVYVTNENAGTVSVISIP